MSQTLMQAYLNSSYTYQEVVLQLQDQPGNPGVPLPPTWVMLTAYNPRSLQLTQEENAQRDQALAAAIRQWGLPLDRYVAGEGEWEEPGCLVRNMSLRQAIDLGKRFEQNAVLWGSGSRVALVWVEPLLVTRHWLAAR